MALFACPCFLGLAFVVPGSGDTLKETELGSEDTQKELNLGSGTRKMSWVSNDNMTLFVYFKLIFFENLPKVIENMCLISCLSAGKCYPLP